MLRTTLALLSACLIATAAAQDNTQALFAQGRNDEAMRALEAQVGTNPFDPVSMNNLAAVKAAHQDWDAAAALLVRAHRLAPTNQVISSNLDQLNEWLARDNKTPRAAKTAATDASTVPQDDLPPEPPALWPLPGSSAARIQAKQPAH